MFDKKTIFYLFIFIICVIKLSQSKITIRQSHKLAARKDPLGSDESITSGDERPNGICRFDEIYNSSGQCEPTCKYPKGPPKCEKLPDEGRCTCRPGLLRRTDKKCVKHEMYAVTTDDVGSCLANETFDECSSHCEATCKFPKGPPKCPLKCTPGCRCAGDLLRRYDGKCVEQTECPPESSSDGDSGLIPAGDDNVNEPGYRPRSDSDTPCPSGEKYTECSAHCEPTCKSPQGGNCDSTICRTGCTCGAGLVRKMNGKCVKLEDCYSKEACNADEVFDECEGGCEPTCENPGLHYCRLICMPGCKCAKGLFRQLDGKCVNLEQCIVPLNKRRPVPVAPHRCWISLNAQQHHDAMVKLEEKYKDVRETYARDINNKAINDNMLQEMRAWKTAAAARAVQKFGGSRDQIPAGLNLGGNCMMRMPGSVLFFYRLKLRNNTQFVVNYMNNDVEQLTLTMRLSLNDLHLVGQYERALTTRQEPSKLFYTPNKGGVEFLLKDVKYKIEGRYRLFDDQLHIEHIISEILPMPILMRFDSDPQGRSTPLEPSSIMDYIQRMKYDLDLWIKDYFNDFFMLFKNTELKQNEKIQEYQNERTILMNQYADEAIDILNKRLRQIRASNLMMPNFTLTAANGMEIRLYSGAVRGVDTMHRRSVTTGKLGDRLRHVDTDIGFGGLKVEYRYDAYVRTGVPPLSGMFVLSTDDVTAHMGLQAILSGKTVVPNLRFSFLEFGKPEALTVEGPANRIIANFKHLLEHHIISIMSSTLIHHINSLSTLVECEPKLFGLVEDSYGSKESEEIDNDIKPTESTPAPTSNSENDKPTEPAESKESSQGNDDEPTEPAPNSGNDEATEPAQFSDNDEKESAHGNSEDEPTEATPNSENEEPKESTQESLESNANNDDSATKQKADYGFERKESIELELPAKEGSLKGEKMKLNHQEKFVLKKIKKSD